MRSFSFIDNLFVIYFTLIALVSLLQLRICAPLATAVASTYSGFGSSGSLALGTFPMIKSKRGSFKHKASTVPTQNGVSTSSLAMGTRVIVRSTVMICLVSPIKSASFTNSFVMITPQHPISRYNSTFLPPTLPDNTGK